MRQLFLLAAAILIHELGHIAAAFSVGVRVRGMRARAGGFYIDADAAGSYPRAALVYLGGAAANLVSALIFRGELGAYCLGAAIFNLLPLPTSDGERALESIVSWLTDDPYLSWRIARAASDAATALLWTSSMYMCLTGRGGAMPLVFATALIVARTYTR